MGLLDFLQGLVKNNKIVFAPQIQILICSNNRDQKIATIDSDTVKVNLQKLTQKEQRQLQKTVFEAHEQSVPVFEHASSKIIYSYQDTIKEPLNKDIVSFFVGKLPSQDIILLRAALYIRTLFNRGKDIHEFRTSLMQRYGIRAKNITNLCTAGYFETWIKPLYEEMASHPGFSLENFLDVYEEIVLYSPFAMFVHISMNIEDIRQGIVQRIKRAKQYGLKNLNIHGIGLVNIRKIRKALEEIEKTTQFVKSITEENNVIVVRLQFDLE